MGIVDYEPATKEIFICPSWGSTSEGHATTHLMWHGYQIDLDDEAAYITFYVPHDFASLVDVKVVLIAFATLTPMSLTVGAYWAKAGTPSTTNTDTNYNYHLNTLMGHIHEVDISDLFTTPSVPDVMVPLQAGHYVAVSPSRILGNNTNCLILGLRFRYNT